MHSLLRPKRFFFTNPGGVRIADLAWLTLVRNEFDELTNEAAEFKIMASQGVLNETRVSFQEFCSWSRFVSATRQNRDRAAGSVNRILDGFCR